MVILSVAILGVIGGISLSSQAAADSARMDQAIMIAQRELTLATTGASGDATKQTQGLFTWTMTHEDKDEGLRLATIVVTWPARGEQKTFQLSKVYRPQ